MLSFPNIQVGKSMKQCWNMTNIFSPLKYIKVVANPSLNFNCNKNMRKMADKMLKKVTAFKDIIFWQECMNINGLYNLQKATQFMSWWDIRKSMLAQLQCFTKTVWLMH